MKCRCLEKLNSEVVSLQSWYKLRSKPWMAIMWDGLIRLCLPPSSIPASLCSSLPVHPKHGPSLAGLNIHSLQSLSFLASRQSDNYLFSFPLLLASREVFWLALVCMKYYQNIAHGSIPAASNTDNMQSQEQWLTGVCLSCSSENSGFCSGVTARIVMVEAMA